MYINIKRWMSSKTAMIKFKMAARRPFWWLQRWRFDSIFFFSNYFNIVHRGCQWRKMLNKLKNHVHKIQNGHPVAILIFSVDRRSSPHFSGNQPRILYTGISIPSAEWVWKPPWSNSKWQPGGHFGDLGNDVTSQKKIFFQYLSISCTEVVYALKCGISSK